MSTPKSLKSPRNGTRSRIYPAPAYLNFTPGGVICPHGEEKNAHRHNLSLISDPTQIIQRALKADTELNLYAQLYAKQDALNNETTICTSEPLPYRTPSLSVLAEATFGALTGVPDTRVRVWADAMVLSYYHAYQRKQSLSTAAPPQLRLRTGEDVPALLTRLKDVAQESKLGMGSGRLNRPCGYIFKRGDIAWNCRTCQTDSTCVLCDNCFRSSDHTGHDVFFHRTTPGGCCDCGDAEAWKPEGCCPRHRPAASPDKSEHSEEGEGKEDIFDEFEAVKASLKGRSDGEAMLKDDDLLTSPFKAALGAVIGAAVQSLVKAMDGAGISADATQWKSRWAEQLARCSAGNLNEEEEPISSSEKYFSNCHSIEEVLNSDEKSPADFKMKLRLHNDDVHTFDEVIVALHQQDRLLDLSNDNDNVNFEDNADHFSARRILVPNRDDAERKTHSVDRDGQVIVKTYHSFKEVTAGFKRLKSNGLHCAVISSPQEDLENRAKILSEWLKDVACAHPAAAALVSHALCDVTEGQDTFGGVCVNTGPRMIPCWSGTLSSIESDEEKKMQRMKAFPPHLATSYLTREEARELYKAMKKHVNSDNLFKKTGSSPNYYDNARFMFLPSDRLQKSPHALWGTLESPPSRKQPMHPLLASARSNHTSINLLNKVYLIDTDLRKQQETEKLTSSLSPHDLIGLNLISGVGLSNSTPHNLDHLLDATSFRAPCSALLVILLSDPYPPKLVRASIHQLFLSLLVDSRFRSRFAAAFGGIAYRPLSTLFCAGCGTEADTPLGFTVQVFTTGSLVRALASVGASQKLLEYDGSEPSLIEACSSNITTFTIPLPLTVIRAVHSNLLGATKEVQMIAQNTISNVINTKNLTYQEGEHPMITPIAAASDDGFLDSRLTKHKRIPHLLRDLEYIFETPGTAISLLLPNMKKISQLPKLNNRVDVNVIEFVQAWARLLRIAQGMDPQKRRTSGGHVEYENARWYEAFGLSINFAGMRDALAESPLSMTCTNEQEFNTMKGAVGNLLRSILQEIKYWLYQEQLFNTGVQSPASSQDSNQLEVLQRSTLHVSKSHVTYANQAFSLTLPSQIDTRLPKKNHFVPIALSCATGIKISENTLDLIELALKKDEEEERHQNTTPGAIMGDWLRVPHSPLMGNSLSFHLPLHRAFAKTIKSFCAVSVSETIRNGNPLEWWKIPLLDIEERHEMDKVGEHFPEIHTLVELLKPTIGIRNCNVTWGGGPDCTRTEAQSRRMRKQAVSSAIAAAKVTHSLCDHPLRCLAASQQIDRHLWARNGNSATGMALNYGSSPLCHSFRDLDLCLVQLSISGFSIGLGARRSFGLLMSRFNLDGYLCDPVNKGVAKNAAGIENESWVNPPLLSDPDCAVVMAEAFFSTLCMLVTELPPPPPLSKEDTTIMKLSMRRELLHALAAESKSYSEALSAASFGTSLREENSTLRNIFSEVLNSIALEKRAQAQVSRAAPPTYELKAECSDEYDPSFYHLRRIEHQHAMDRVARLRKQKSKSKQGNICLPLVTAPSTPHLRFSPCRLILHLPSMDAAIRRMLLFSLTGGSWLPPPKPIPPDLDSASSNDDTLPALRSIRHAPRTRRGLNRKAAAFAHKKNKKPDFSPSVVAASSVSFLEVLQTLTIQIHTLTECASLHRTQNLDEETHNLSSGLSMNSYLSRLIFVPESLRDCWALGCPTPLSSAGSGLMRGSILGLLIALYEHRNENNAAPGSTGNDDDGGGAPSLVSEGLKWFLRVVNKIVNTSISVENARKCAMDGTFNVNNLDTEDSTSFSLSMDASTREIIKGMTDNLPNLWPKEKDSSPSQSSAALSNSKSREARKAAQKRLMEKMRQRQANFAKSITDAEEGESKKTDGIFQEMDEDEDVCIICRCDDEATNGPLGFLGHVQRSKVLQVRGMSELCHGDDLDCTARVVGSKGCQVRNLLLFHATR